MIIILCVSYSDLVFEVGYKEILYISSFKGILYNWYMVFMVYLSGVGMVVYFYNYSIWEVKIGMLLGEVSLGDRDF